MKNPTKLMYERLVPSHEALWDQGGAEMRSVEIDTGRYEDVPFFNLEISSLENTKNDRIIDHRGRDVGQHYSYNVHTSDGIDRTARVYIPDDSHRSSNEMYLQANTAWLTTITGHNDYAASTFVSRTGLPMIVIGAEHGTNQNHYPQELLRIPETLLRSQTISLAKSAQSGQLISASLAKKFDLPSVMIATGESRGAMVAPGQLPYAKEYETTIPYMDITAPCVPRRLLSERADWLRLARWPTSEVLGTVALGLSLAEQKTLKRKMGTVAFNPNFLVSNLTGVRRSLFSGEAGEFTKWVPRDIAKVALYMSTFKNDTVSRPDVWADLYAEHENVFIREHTHGSHLTLANDDVLHSKAVRINKVQELYGSQGGIQTIGDFADVINTRRHGETDFVYQMVA